MVFGRCQAAQSGLSIVLSVFCPFLLHPDVLGMAEAGRTVFAATFLGR